MVNVSESAPAVETAVPATEAPATEAKTAPNAPKSRKTSPKPKAKGKPKAAPKVSKTKGKAKKAGKASPKAPAGTRGPAKKEGLRLMQLRALKALRASGGSLTMEKLCSKAGIGEVVMRRGVGPIDPDCRAGHDKLNGFPCLLTLGMVKVDKDDVSGDTNYVLSAKGRDAADKIEKLPSVHVAPPAKKGKK